MTLRPANKPFRGAALSLERSLGVEPPGRCCALDSFNIWISLVRAPNSDPVQTLTSCP